MGATAIAGERASLAGVAAGPYRIGQCFRVPVNSARLLEDVYGVFWPFTAESIVQHRTHVGQGLPVQEARARYITRRLDQLILVDAQNRRSRKAA